MFLYKSLIALKMSQEPYVYVYVHGNTDAALASWLCKTTASVIATEPAQHISSNGGVCIDVAGIAVV